MVSRRWRDVLATRRATSLEWRDFRPGKVKIVRLRFFVGMTTSVLGSDWDLESVTTSRFLLWSARRMGPGS